MPGVSRVNSDRAGGILISGASTVTVNGQPAAHFGSRIGTPPNAGDTIVGKVVPSVTVEGKAICVTGSVTARGFAASGGSPNVSAG
jgi:uncharacterized Zn-binding protein involved in type VI secretion